MKNLFIKSTAIAGSIISLSAASMSYAADSVNVAFFLEWASPNQISKVDKVYDESLCQDNDCESGVTEANQFCYKATCYETAIQLAKRFKLKKSNYSVGFQSRLGKGWIEPFSDKLIEELAKKGAKKLLVFSPAFVADCLETTIEIGDEYQELFEEFGGEKVQLVESLNSSDIFVKGLSEIVLKRSI